MNRVATLTETEYQVLTAVRSMVTDVENTTRIASGDDIRMELSAIYQDLVYAAPDELEQVVPEIVRRIYALLY